MTTTLSVIPPVVPWAATAGGGAAVRLLQAGHMVVPSAICVPHPLQKAIDFPHTSGFPKIIPRAVRLDPNGESYQNRGSKANRIARQPNSRATVQQTHSEDFAGRAFNINVIRRLGPTGDHLESSGSLVPSGTAPRQRNS